jgi:hypothetical protein
VRHVRGQTSLNSPSVLRAPVILLAKQKEHNMGNKDHHQRRRRRVNCVWLFKLIVLLAQATYFVGRFFFFFMERK